MVQKPGWVRGFYIAVLWSTRGWKDLYKVREYSLRIGNDTD